MKIQKITLADIEWNEWNGFVLTILGIEYQGKKKGFEGELLGLHIASDVVLLYFLFIEIEFKSQFLK